MTLGEGIALRDDPGAGLREFDERMFYQLCVTIYLPSSRQNSSDHWTVVCTFYGLNLALLASCGG
jgi:hypothetical protein